MTPLRTGERLTGEADLYARAVMFATRDKPSTSYLQRRLQVPYAQAAGLIVRMEKEGLVSLSNYAGKRTVLVPYVGPDLDSIPAPTPAADLTDQTGHVRKSAENEHETTPAAIEPEAGGLSVGDRIIISDPMSPAWHGKAGVLEKIGKTHRPMLGRPTTPAFVRLDDGTRGGFEISQLSAPSTEAGGLEVVGWRYRYDGAVGRKWSVQKNHPEWWRDNQRDVTLEPLTPKDAAEKLVAELRSELAAYRSAADLEARCGDEAESNLAVAVGALERIKRCDLSAGSIATEALDRLKQKGGV